jgi:hypothetical protein
VACLAQQGRALASGQAGAVAKENEHGHLHLYIV